MGNGERRFWFTGQSRCGGEDWQEFRDDRGGNKEGHRKH
jgi:hypothetical protein